MSLSDSLRLDGRCALVTGASRGIGRAIAEAFAEAGAEVALAARTVPDLETVAAAVGARAGRAVVLPLDVRDVAAVEGAVVRAAEALGGLDILVNNAGVYFHATVDEFTPEQFQRVLDVNLRAAVFAMQAARPLMRERGGGVIVNISSIAAKKGGPNVYGASKAALESFHPQRRPRLGAGQHPVRRYCAGHDRHGNGGGGDRRSGAHRPPDRDNCPGPRGTAG